MKRLPLALALLLFAAACHAPAPAPPSLERVAVFQKVELAFDRPIDQVAFTLPGGRIINVPSFPSRGRFLVRFAARVPGAYHWSGGGRQGDFEAVAAAGHGQVARDPHAAHRLMLTDGTPFWPLGENRFNVYDPTWNYQHQSIEQYLASMQAAGENTLRLFVICDCEDESRADRVQLGCLEPSPGRFDEAAAERYDRIVDAAERDGIYVIFGVWAIGFTEGNDTWKSWADNPYRALGSRNQFFTDESIRRVAAGKLRYVAARWGWSTHLLAVDLLNEPEWDGRIPENVWIPWAEKMEKAWRADDPFGHLVTAGPVGLQYNLGGDERPWYGYAGDDLVQWHLYGKEFYEPHALADEMTRKVREVWGFDKPILVGEFGYGGEDKTTYDHTHVGIWSATFAGAGVLMHSAPAFNIDSDEPMTPARAAHVLGLSRFLASLPPVPFTPGPAEATRGVRAWSLRAPGVAAVWLLAPLEGYGLPLTGAQVTLPGLDGRWEASFVDELTSAVLSRVQVSASAGEPLVVPVPPFVRHLAIRLRRR